MGYDIGNGIWQPELRAGYEDTNAMLINTSLFELNRIAKLSHLDIFKAKDGIRRIQRSEKMVIKDPRFTWDPIIIHLWKDVYPDLEVLLIGRKFEDVMKSRRKIGNVGWREKEVTVDKLKNDYFSFLLQLYSLNIPFTIISYPTIIDHYEDVYDACEFLGLPFDREKGEKAWKALAKKDMVSEF
jgi:hypothetical protein